VTTLSAPVLRDNFFELGRLNNAATSTSFAISTCGTTSGSGPSIETNFIRGFEDGIATENCNVGSDYVEVADNVLSNMTGDNILNNGGNPTVTGNICDDVADCPAPTSPFLLP